MTDDLIARLRRLVIMDEVGSNNQLGKEAADALEAQARRITALLPKLSDLEIAIDVNLDLIENQAARIAELKAALKEALDYIDDPYNDLAIQIGELLNRAARTALEKKND